MGVETKAYFIRQIGDEKFSCQLCIATVNIGCLCDELEGVFHEVDEKDIIDFNTNHKSETNGHMTKRYKDCYGNSLKVAELIDVWNILKNYREKLEYNQLFRSMVQAFVKDKRERYRIFIEEY